MTRLVLLMTLCLAAGGASPEPIRVLFLTGQTDLPYHDWRVSTPFLRGVLAGTGRFDVKVLEEVRGVTPATLAGTDVLVLNYNGPRWGDATETAIEEFVKSGKGLVSFHGVTYGEFYGQVFEQRWVAGGTKGWLAYPRIIGAQWEPSKIGHGARHVFTVKWVDRGHPISAGLEESFLANDELYHKLDLLPDAKVLATAFSAPETGGTGKAEPIVWTTAFGRGRSVHLTLGHDLSAMSQPGFLTALARGVEWAAIPGCMVREGQGIGSGFDLSQSKRHGNFFQFVEGTLYPIGILYRHDQEWLQTEHMVAERPWPHGLPKDGHLIAEALLEYADGINNAPDVTVIQKAGRDCDVLRILPDGRGRPHRWPGAFLSPVNLASESGGLLDDGKHRHNAVEA